MNVFETLPFNELTEAINDFLVSNVKKAKVVIKRPFSADAMVVDGIGSNTRLVSYKTIHFIGEETAELYKATQKNDDSLILTFKLSPPIYLFQRKEQSTRYSEFYLTVQNGDFNRCEVILDTIGGLVEILSGAIVAMEDKEMMEAYEERKRAEMMNESIYKRVNDDNDIGIW